MKSCNEKSLNDMKLPVTSGLLLVGEGLVLGRKPTTQDDIHNMNS
jgi:hypothetical protein